MGSGFRSLPEAIKAQIDAIGGVPFVFGAYKPYTAELASDWTTRLELEEVADATWVGLPPAISGQWSRWNILGREVIRKDLPKVYRSWSIEAPDFNGPGTHSITFTREVYQKQRLWGAQVEAQVTRVDESIESLLGTVSMTLDGPYDEGREKDYLYAASLCRTWFGSVQVLPISSAGVPEIPTQYFGWEFLPKGTVEEIRAAVEERFGSRATPREVEIMIDRLQKVESLNPVNRMVGETGMQKYIGYQFGDDFVAFENPRVGNALYLMYGDWDAMSRVSRTELLSGQYGGDFNRIIHSARWFEKLRMAVYSYRNT